MTKMLFVRSLRRTALLFVVLGLGSTGEADTVQNPGIFNITFSDFDVLIGYPCAAAHPICRLVDPVNTITITVNVASNGFFRIDAFDFIWESCDNFPNTQQIYHVSDGFGSINGVSGLPPQGRVRMSLSGTIEWGGIDFCGVVITPGCMLEGTLDLDLSTAFTWTAWGSGSPIDPNTGIFTMATSSGLTVFPRSDPGLCPANWFCLDPSLCLPDLGPGNGGAFFQFVTIDPIPL